MDTPRSDRETVRQVIQHYAQFKPSHGDIRLDIEAAIEEVMQET